MMRFQDDERRTYAYLESGRLVLTEEGPAHFESCRRLDLSGNQDLVELPDGLAVETLLLRGCTRLARLPDGLQVRFLNAVDCPGLTGLPRGLACDTLKLHGTRVRTLPDDLQVSYLLDLTDCPELTHVPAGLRVGWHNVPQGTPTGGALILRRCTALESLPDGLDVCLLDVRGCTRLAGWPHGATGRIGRLRAGGCSSLETLPLLRGISHLDVTDCTTLSLLPEGFRVSGAIEIANTGIKWLPDSLRDVGLRWRGVQIDERIAFLPETIGARDVLSQSNAELRRVMLERVGLDRFFEEVHPEVLDKDRDAGGERKLLRVQMADDEPLVCVLVHCPSTGRRYLLRVPPTMRTCRQAIAWTAGFADPGLYRPLIET
jgi:hypothetical protein